MQQKPRSQGLIKRAAQILKRWVTDDEIKYPGIVFHHDAPEWRGGYGVPVGRDVPEFVKEDNDGWDYIHSSNSK